MAAGTVLVCFGVPQMDGICGCCGTAGNLHGVFVVAAGAAGCGVVGEIGVAGAACGFAANNTGKASGVAGATTAEVDVW